MRFEAEQGKDTTVDGASVRFSRLRLRKMATAAGELVVRPIAEACVGPRRMAFEVEEGSLFHVDGRRYVVLKISPAKGIVRFRSVDAPRGRFEEVIERADQSTSNAGMWIGPLVEGARILTNVINGLDDHPDTIARYSPRLERARRYLAFASQTVSQQDPADVQRWLSRNVQLAEELHDIIARSTCETMPQIEADPEELRRSPRAQRAHAERLWLALIEQFGVPKPLSRLSDEERRRAIEERRALRLLSSSDGFGGGHVRVALVGGDNAEPTAIEHPYDVYFEPPCRLTAQTARELSRNPWEKIREFLMI